MGAANGLIVGFLRANSNIVTVGMQFVVTGCVLLYVAGQHVRVDNATPFYFALSGGYLFGIPVPVYLFLLATTLCHLLMTRTLFGRYVRAIGGNEEAARLVGVPVARYVLYVHLISAAGASVSGIILASRVRNLDPTVGIGYEFSALTAVVLGGARLSGAEAMFSIHSLACSFWASSPMECAYSTFPLTCSSWCKASSSWSQSHCEPPPRWTSDEFPIHDITAPTHPVVPDRAISLGQRAWTRILVRSKPAEFGRGGRGRRRHGHGDDDRDDWRRL